ncbi:hypothetical protein BGY98DRAFT_1189497 [Russula aff. rugulosa BPL654]|nr:hypothetical protein BGY98DRAFT_1189497 [Russula aff. rugulosa BPL654]
MPTFDKSNIAEGAQQFLESDDTGPLHQNLTIETLSDDVLLAIFTSYLHQSEDVDAWRHLNLRLKCTFETPAREMLDIWPAFPIVVTDESNSISGVDNIIAALEQYNRVCDITLDDLPCCKMDMFVSAMLEPFPALEKILLGADDSTMAVVPDSFLGGSAPQLQWLTFHAIPFPALPTLLSSARNLVDIQLSGIPRSGYVSPEAMATCLSAIPGLKYLRFEFDSPQSFPNGESRRHPPLARSTLPALHELIFEGINEYFEDLVSRIDTPVIRELKITFFHQHFYEFSQLSQFIGRVEVFKSPGHTNMELLNGVAEVSVSLGTGTDRPASLMLGVFCVEPYLQLRYFVQVCSSSLLPFSNVESLAISSGHQWQHPQGPTAEDFLWLDLLHLFSVVKVLRIDKNSLTPVAHTLKEVVKERITGMFPAIRELSMMGERLPSGPVLRAVEEFATARGLFTRLDRPHRWVAG